MLSDAIARFSTAIADGVTTYQVNRVGLGSYGTNGRYTFGATTNFNIDASIWPYDGKELLPLQLGQHAHDVLVLVTTSPLYTIDPKNGAGDRVVVPRPQSDGSVVAETYVVLKISGPFWMNAQPMYKAFVARQTVP